MISVKNPVYLVKAAWLTGTLPILMLANGCAWQYRTELEAREQELLSKEQMLDQRQLSLEQQHRELNLQLEQLNTESAEIAAQREQLEQESRKLEVLRKSLSTLVQAAPPKVVHNSIEEIARIVVGQREPVFLDPPGLTLTARIDTGIQTSALNALDITEFERDGKPYVKFYVLHPKNGKKVEMVRRVRKRTSVKQPEENGQRRPVVKLRVVLGNIDRRAHFTLVDRTNSDHQVVIGRNVLTDFAVVDVAEQNLTKPLIKK